jgi:hypothetical protein
MKKRYIVKIIAIIVFIGFFVLLSNWVKSKGLDIVWMNPNFAMVWQWVWTMCFGIFLAVLSIEGKIAFSVTWPFLAAAAVILVFDILVSQTGVLYPLHINNTDSVIVIKVIIGNLLARGLLCSKVHQTDNLQ